MRTDERARLQEFRHLQRIDLGGRHARRIRDRQRHVVDAGRCRDTPQLAVTREEQVSKPRPQRDNRGRCAGRGSDRHARRQAGRRPRERRRTAAPHGDSAAASHADRAVVEIVVGRQVDRRQRRGRADHVERQRPGGRGAAAVGHRHGDRRWSRRRGRRQRPRDRAGRTQRETGRREAAERVRRRAAGRRERGRVPPGLASRWATHRRRSR